MTMFWGMTLEPGKLYTETMGEEVQLSMAAIDSRKDLGESSGTNFCQIVIQTEKGEYVLCTLVHGVMFQQNLDLKLMPREKVTFSVQGPSVVYLVGYTASYPEDEEGIMHGDYDEDSSAWDTLEEGDLAPPGEQAPPQIKEEPVEILDDSDTDVETDSKAEVQEQIAAMAQEQQAEGAVTSLEDPSKESAEDMIFSVAEIDQPVVKTEPPEPGPPVLTPVDQQLPPQDNLYGMQTTDHGRNLPQTSTSQDFFYPDLQQQQQQTDVPLTAPVAFQPITSGTEFQQQNPQGGVLPPAETFLQTQKPFMQRSHAGPIRHSTPRQPAQRNYPSPRRGYGTNRKQPAGKTRAAPQPMNVQQIRNAGSMQQQQHPQSMPGPSQQDLPGPSTSGPQEQMSSVMQTPNADPHPAERDDQPKQPAVVQSPVLANPSLGTRGNVAKKPKTTAGTMQPLFCHRCGKKFTDRIKYRTHEYNHRRARCFPCSYCPRMFHSRDNKVNHERTHTGEKPFQCRYCDRTFSRKDSCRGHEITHFKG